MTTSAPSPATRRRHPQSPAVAVVVATLAACTGAPAHETSTVSVADRRPAASSEHDAAVERDVKRVRAATAPYRVLDSAVAVGYPREVRSCIEHLPRGAMGFHHVNRALLDDQLEIHRPEILLYARTAAGDYKLTGVEFIVPYTARPRDAEPPTVMGQKLKRSDSLKLWYLHVWAWEENPSGLFADWNPAVKC